MYFKSNSYAGFFVCYESRFKILQRMLYLITNFARLINPALPSFQDCDLIQPWKLNSKKSP